MTTKDINQYKKTVYDLGNGVLYQMCADNFKHDTVDKILAKTVIIGRTYAASLDRGRDKNKSEQSRKAINDDFYQKQIVPIFLNSELDAILKSLLKYKSAKAGMQQALEAHGYLTKKLHKINKQNKRSFSSKYLHFHLPNLFFLYDTRAKAALSKLVKLRFVHSSINKKIDSEYFSFYQKSLYLQEQILKKTGTLLTPRQLDNYLLNISNENLRSLK